MGDVDQVEQNHKQKGSNLIIMCLSSQPRRRVKVIGKDKVHEHGEDDDIEGLSEIAFVHDWDNSFSFCFILLNFDYPLQNIPDGSIEKVYYNYIYEGHASQRRILLQEPEQH